MISVIIPVLNGGAELRRCLEAIGAQHVDDEVEVVVVDSGSVDGSPEEAERWGAVVRHFPRTEPFRHGRARNIGADASRGDILVFTSQDAHADSPSWLAALTAGLAGAEGEVAGVYGRQVAHPDAAPPEVFFLDFLYGARARVQRASRPHDLSMQTTLFSNANSAIPRALFDRHRFAEDIVMSEDQEWSRRVLLEGHAVRYVPEAVVRHSHPYTMGEAFRRFFDSGVSAERAYLAGGAHAWWVLWAAAGRYAVREVGWLWRTGRRRWIPYASVYELVKFIGLQLGTRHRLLPRWLKRRCSAMPSFWT